MSKDMKIIMESWRYFSIEEQNNHVLRIHEHLINEFVRDIQVLQEGDADLNEILSRVGDFAKKAYGAYKDLQRGAIKGVLTKAIDGGLKALDFIEDRLNQENPALITKVRSILNMLKTDENMHLAISIVSIIIGLMTGEAFDVLGKVLDLIEAAPNLIQAFESISTLTDTANVKAAADKSGTLTTNLT